MCFGENPDEACGWPPKTIRAIISLTACLVSFGILAFLAIYMTLQGEYTNAMGVVSVLSGELGTIVGYYFGSRSRQESRQELAEQRRLLLSQVEDV